MKQNWQIGRLRAYYRTSSEQQERDETIEAQRRFVRRHCERLGVPLEKEYADDGVSGLSEISDREQGAALLRAAQRGEFDTVIVFAVDRLGRESYYILHAFHHLRRAGVRIISATEVFDPDEPTGRLLVSLLAGKAESDKITIHNRTASGKEKLLESDDQYLGGVVPYGYHLVWSDKKQLYAACDTPIPGAEEWTPHKVILYLYERSDQGVTCWVLAQELNALGLPTCWVPGDRRYNTPSRSRWFEQRVAQILRNPFYRGEQIVGAPGKSRRTQRDTPVVRKVPRLVSDDLWQSAQATLHSNRQLSPRNSKQEYLLTGKIVCAHCRSHYCGTPSVSGFLPRGRYYRCRQAKRYVNDGRCLTSRWLDATDIEEQVKAQVTQILLNVDAFVEELQVAGDGERDQIECRLNEADTLDQQRQNLARRELEYFRQRAEGLIRTDDILRQLLAELTDADQALAARAQQLRQEAAAAMQTETGIAVAADVLKEMAPRLEQGFTFAEWRWLVGKLVKEIIVTTSGTRRQKEAVVDIRLWVAPLLNEPPVVYLSVARCFSCPSRLS